MFVQTKQILMACNNNIADIVIECKQQLAMRKYHRIM